MVYEGREGQLIQAGSGEDRQFSYMWVLALVLIFFALIFWRRDDKKDHNEGRLIEGLALGKMMQGHNGHNGNNYCNGYNHQNGSELRDWDILRDNMREFANVREEVRTVGHQNAMDNAKYFYDQRNAMCEQNRNTDRGFFEQARLTDRGFFDQARISDRNNHDAQIGFKNVEIGNLVQTKDILARIDRMENGLKEDRIRHLESELNHFKITHSIRGHGAIPAYPVAGPAPLASGFVHAMPPCHG